MLQRIRFEHPEVACVVLTSARERMFCAGANIYMLGTSTHAWKVNFCKFTNETRNGMEDSSRHDGLKFLAALNGTTAGGGYELALACDEIVLIDDRSSAVSLPEVPLLGVLPGTGGLTRLIDKRKVRRDLADIFCTNPTACGASAPRSGAWSTTSPRRRSFRTLVRARAEALAADSDRPADAKGVTLTAARSARSTTAAITTSYVDVDVRPRSARTRRSPSRLPKAISRQIVDEIHAAGASGGRWRWRASSTTPS